MERVDRDALITTAAAATTAAKAAVKAGSTTASAVATAAADDEEGLAATVVAGNVPLEVWNAFAEDTPDSDRLPNGFCLRSMMWHDGAVSIVEFPLGSDHGVALSEARYRVTTVFVAGS